MRVGGLLLVGLCGCSLNQGGQGSSSDAAPGEDETGGSMSAADTAMPDTGVMTGSMSDGSADDPTANPTTTPGDDSTTDPTQGSDDTTSGPPGCPPDPPFAQLIMAADATIEPPAILAPSWAGLADDPLVTYSLVDDMGQAHFDFDVPCNGAYHVWAVVWDRYEGTGFSCGSTENADSVFVYPDDNIVAEDRWNWGCNSCGLSDSLWQWARAQSFEGSNCVTEDISFNWSAGEHRISFRNEHAGELLDADFPDVAAIAAVVISSDPGFDPSTLYSP